MAKVFLSKTFFLLLMSVCSSIPGMSQVTKEQGVFLESASKLFSATELSYHYRVSMIDASKNEIVDTISGVLYRNGNNYLDSNNAILNMVSDGIFFKADYVRKTAHIYNINLLRKNMGFEPLESGNNGVINIPDSLISKLGKFSSKELPGDVMEVKYVLKSSNESNGLKYLIFNFNRKDNRLLAATIEIQVTDQWGDALPYAYRYYITNIENKPTKGRIEPGNYFRVKGKDVTLIGRYARFEKNVLL